MALGLVSQPEMVVTTGVENWKMNLVDMRGMLWCVFNSVKFIGALVPDEEVLVEGVFIAFSKVLEEIFLVEDFPGFSGNVGLEGYSKR